MKIVFVCGSLEPGHDGVGDYVRRLAIEIIKQGNEARAIALNERKLQTYCIEDQSIKEDSLQVLRIPDVCSDSERFERAKNFIKDFDPEWISLQFVPYSFNHKGFVFKLGQYLKTLGTGHRWHIMIHELWVGRDENSDWKRFFVSKLQKALIKRMIREISPAIIHTHLPVFYSRIKEWGYHVKQLPLFSNIEVNKKNIADKRAKVFKVGFFSQADANGPMMAFLSKLGREILKKGLEFEIILIGGNENRMKSIANALEKIESVKRPVKYTGFLESDEISASIQDCSIGITPIPKHVLGKSGSVAAFITHGIPVAAPNSHPLYDKDAIGFFSRDLCDTIITEPGFSTIESAKNAAIAVRSKIQLCIIAETFLNDIANFDNGLVN